MQPRQKQQFTAQEVIKRLQQSVNRVMFYVDQNKVPPADAILFVREQQDKIREFYK